MVSIILPAYNENTNVGRAYHAIKDILKNEEIPFELVFVNAYSAKSAHPFRRNGAPFRLKLSNAQLVN